jgi:DNA polymerase-3 subunit epsilon
VNWRTARWSVIDTETTGIDPATARVVDLGVVIVEGGAIVERCGWLINPGTPIPPECTAIHGITDDHVRDAQSFADVAAELARAVEGSIPVAFNARFDRALLLAEHLRTSHAPPKFLHRGDANAWIDAYVWSRARDPYAKGKGSQKLGAVAARLGVEVGQAHRAVGDCETTARVLGVLAGVALHRDSKLERIPETFADLVLHQRRLTAERDASFVSWLIEQQQQETAAA